MNVNDSHWYNEYYQKAAKFKGIIDFLGVDRISPKIEVSVLFSPKREQPKSILVILGTNGEFVKGPGAERTGNFTVYQISKFIGILFKK